MATPEQVDDRDQLAERSSGVDEAGAASAATAARYEREERARWRFMIRGVRAIAWVLLVVTLVHAIIRPRPATARDILMMEARVLDEGAPNWWPLDDRDYVAWEVSGVRSLPPILEALRAHLSQGRSPLSVEVAEARRAASRSTARQPNEQERDCIEDDFLIYLLDEVVDDGSPQAVEGLVAVLSDPAVEHDGGRSEWIGDALLHLCAKGGLARIRAAASDPQVPEPARRFFKENVGLYDQGVRRYF